MDKYLKELLPSRITTVPMSTLYIVRINEDIGNPSEFEDILSLLDSAREHDVIHFKFNSGGGRADTMLELRSAMMSCPAHLVAEVTGDCCSAATVLFLSCDEFIVNPNISFMCHSASYGAIGKSSDIEDKVAFSSKLHKTLLKDVYQGFFTDKEIKKLVKGKEYWLDAEQVANRLEARTEYFEDLEKQETKEAIANSEDFIPNIQSKVEQLESEGLSKKEIKEALKSMVEHLDIKVNVNSKIEDIIISIKEQAENLDE